MQKDLMNLIRDHLHTRGEYLLVLLSNHLYLGSPPHSWRILQPLSISSKIDRITSTLVENTFSFAEHNLLGEDHLHTRGEYSHLQLRQLNQSGSPPHSWRIPTMHSSSLIPYRITSTLVENTSCYLGSIIRVQDHLHTRGEYPIILHQLETLIGSPPHSWRIPCNRDFKFIILGITSTLVENTCVGVISTGHPEDHLHTRGEYTK